jgi:hypothetical protein
VQTKHQERKWNQLTHQKDHPDVWSLTIRPGSKYLISEGKSICTVSRNLYFKAFSHTFFLFVPHKNPKTNHHFTDKETMSLKNETISAGLLAISPDPGLKSLLSASCSPPRTY